MSRTAAVLHEHAARVLETNELVLSEILRQLEERHWEDVARDGRFWTYLLRAAGDLGQPTGIVLADAEGRVRMTTTCFPAAHGDSLAGQEDVESLRDRRARRISASCNPPCGRGSAVDGPRFRRPIRLRANGRPAWAGDLPRNAVFTPGRAVRALPLRDGPACVASSPQPGMLGSVRRRCSSSAYRSVMPAM